MMEILLSTNNNGILTMVFMKKKHASVFMVIIKPESIKYIFIDLVWFALF